MLNEMLYIQRLGRLGKAPNLMEKPNPVENKNIG